MATTGHESEIINVGGLKASLQKLKTDIIDDKYEKPSGGIPDTDLSSGVQTSLGKADTALQSHQSKADLGLDNVTNDAQVKRTEMGVASGVATLDESGLVLSTQLPSYVDDVVDLIAISATAPEHCAKGDLYFNTTTNKVVRATATDTWGTSAATNTDPEKSKIYVNTAYDRTYRWSGSTMVEVSSSDVTGIKVGSSGSIITPSQGVITIPSYETNADVTDAENVKAALGTDSTHGGAFLRKDGTWQIPPDTEYGEATTSSAGLMNANDKTKLDGIETGAQAHIAPTSTEVKSALGTGTADGTYLAKDGTWATPPNTTYESKAAASGGSDVSLVTTGEKYTWNGKQDALTFNSTPSSSNKVATMNDIPSSLPANGGNADTVDGYHISVVSSMPSSPDANTIYIVK